MDINAMLTGKAIAGVWMDEDHLKFATDKGDLFFTVYGDCCSHSYFYDFHGVKKLLANGPVVSAGEVALDDSDAKPRHDECVKVYGFEIVTEDPVFGEVTSVFSFRNDSNGYYGGEMEESREFSVEGVPQLTDDCLGTEAS